MTSALRFLPEDDCKTADEVRERARVVMERRKAMIAAPALVTPALLMPLPKVVAKAVPKVVVAPVAETPLRPAPPPKPPRRVISNGERTPLAAVVRVTCEHFGITQDDLYSGGKAARLVRMRHIFIYTAIKRTSVSLAGIARMCLGGDHSSVIYANRRITALLAAGDHQVREDVDTILDALQQEFPNAEKEVERKMCSRMASPEAPNRGIAWSDEEVVHLTRRYWDERAPAEVVAAELGRGADAVVRKAQGLGLLLSQDPTHPYGRPYTEEDVQEVKRLWHDGVVIREIAKQTNRSLYSIEKKLKMLGLRRAEPRASKSTDAVTP